MGSGSGAQQQSQTITQLPAWAQPFARTLGLNAMNTYFPGGAMQPASNAVAGFSPDQLAAMQMVEKLSGVQPNAGMGYNNFTAGAGGNQYGSNPTTQPAPPYQGG